MYCGSSTTENSHFGFGLFVNVVVFLPYRSILFHIDRGHPEHGTVDERGTLPETQLSSESDRSKERILGRRRGGRKSHQQCRSLLYVRTASVGYHGIVLFTYDLGSSSLLSLQPRLILSLAQPVVKVELLRRHFVLRVLFKSTLRR
jgi:hypothetical protein